MTRTVFLLALGACARTPAPPPPVHNTPPPAKSAAAACGPDIATRAPGSQPADPIDLDGDGDLDLLFADGGDMFGNATFTLYRRDGACATYLGQLQAFVTEPPRCAAPPAGNTPCRLAVDLRMFHDDFQQVFYRFDGTSYQVEP